MVKIHSKTASDGKGVGRRAAEMNLVLMFDECLKEFLKQVGVVMIRN